MNSLTNWGLVSVANNRVLSMNLYDVNCYEAPDNDLLLHIRHPYMDDRLRNHRSIIDRSYTERSIYFWSLVRVNMQYLMNMNDMSMMQNMVMMQHVQNLQSMNNNMNMNRNNNKSRFYRCRHSNNNRCYAYSQARYRPYWLVS